MDFLRCCFPQKKELLTVKDVTLQNSKADPKLSIGSNGFNREKGYSIQETPSFAKTSYIHGEESNFESESHKKSQFSNKYKRTSVNSSDLRKESRNIKQSELEEISEKNSEIKRTLQDTVVDPTKMNSSNKPVLNFEDTSLFDFITNNRNISEQDTKQAPLIVIQEIEGKMLNGEKLTINAQGLIGGNRRAKDGISFFGPKSNSDNDQINDFNLNIDTKDNSIHTFIIYFKREENKFFLRSFKDKDQNSFPIVLVQLDYEFAIKRKQIFKIAENYFQCQMIDNENLEVIKLETKTKEKEKFLFSPSDSPITIGRNKKCKIAYVNDKSFSRVQTTIFYENEKWFIKDGDEKPSTNGTWLYAQNSYEIQNNTHFRVFNSILKATVKNNVHSFLKNLD